MTERERVTKYLMCDGCAYTIDPVRPYTVLTILEPGKEAMDLHFHSPRATEHDCLYYWVTNRKAREAK